MQASIQAKRRQIAKCLLATSTFFTLAFGTSGDEFAWPHLRVRDVVQISQHVLSADAVPANLLPGMCGYVKPIDAGVDIRVLFPCLSKFRFAWYAFVFKHDFVNLSRLKS